MKTKDGFYTDNMVKGEGILIEVLGEGGGRYMLIPNHNFGRSGPSPLRIRPDGENDGLLMLKIGGKEIMTVPEGEEIELCFVSESPLEISDE